MLLALSCSFSRHLCILVAVGVWNSELSDQFICCCLFRCRVCDFATTNMNSLKCHMRRHPQQHQAVQLLEQYKYVTGLMWQKALTVGVFLRSSSAQILLPSLLESFFAPETCLGLFGFFRWICHGTPRQCFCWLIKHVHEFPLGQCSVFCFPECDGCTQTAYCKQFLGRVNYLSMPGIVQEIV